MSPLCTDSSEFLIHHNLQGSQTRVLDMGYDLGFLSIIIYKVLKLLTQYQFQIPCFLSIIIYKVLKRALFCTNFLIRFLSIIIYKVLKLHQICVAETVSFLSIIIYKVLKRGCWIERFW